MNSPAPAPPLSSVSAHFTAQRETLLACAPLGPVADLACGRGRHALAAATWGLPVLAVDRNPAFLGELNRRAKVSDLPVACIRADLEAASSTLPLEHGSCGAVLIFRFLFRPLVPSIVRLLAPGGLLVYETFTLAQAEREGGPNNPAFMLGPGEMAELFPDLLTLSCQEDPVGACARLVAQKPG